MTRRAKPTHKWVLKSPMDIALAMPPGPVPKDRTAYLEQCDNCPPERVTGPTRLTPSEGGDLLSAATRRILTKRETHFNFFLVSIKHSFLVFLLISELIYQ